MAGRLEVLSKDKRMRIELEVGESAATLRIGGAITELLDADQIVKKLMVLYPKVQRLNFDLRQVESLNSRGIKSFVFLVHAMEGHMSLTFLSLSEAFIQQASVIPNLLGEKRHTIVAFQAPYFCKKCKLRTVKNLKVSELQTQDGQLLLPDVQCEKCKGVTEFDEIQEQYMSVFRSDSY